MSIETQDPQVQERRELGLPADAPDGAVDAAHPDRDARVEDEKDALDWLLGPTRPLEFDVPVDFETPAGMTKLTFHMQQLDGGRLMDIDDENRKGDGPFAKLDRIGFASQVVAESTLYIQSESGRRVDVKTQEFLGGVPAPSLAMRARFKRQEGILETLAEVVREKAGYGAERVGTAQRSLIEVGKG